MLATHPAVRRRFRGICALAVAAALAAPLPPVDLETRANHLREMTPAERQRIRQDYEAFKKLPAAEQQRLIALNRQIEALPEPDRRRLLETMDRYHHWLDMLPQYLRKRIRETPPEQRLNAVLDAYAEAKGAASAARKSARARNRPLAFYGLALRVWEKLPPEQQATLSALPADERRAWIWDYARTLRMVSVPTPEEAKRLFQSQPNEIRDWLNTLAPKRRSLEVRWLFQEQLVPLSSIRGLPEPPADALLTFFTTELPPWLRDELALATPHEAHVLTVALFATKHPEYLPRRNRQQAGKQEAAGRRQEAVQRKKT